MLLGLRDCVQTGHPTGDAVVSPALCWWFVHLVARAVRMSLRLSVKALG